MTASTALLAEIGNRFKSGDPAAEPLARLATLVATLSRPAPGEVPVELHAEIAQLLVRVQEVIGAGEGWLEQAGPELASLHRRQRLQRVYGVT